MIALKKLMPFDAPTSKGQIKPLPKFSNKTLTLAKPEDKRFLQNLSNIFREGLL
jgi:O-succinylbenzoate synthase